ncbi:MAG: LptF/LptG family permease [Cyclobacteriaceae bacterium]|nr:LptF/LptG family permease [Cyclobacteriaceae bacterium]
MTILDRYIIKKILATFFYVVLILVAIITVIDVTEKIDKFVINNLSTARILGYYGDFIPWIAGLISPITVFITIVYVTSRMAAHTEIIAILSSGVSFRRLLVPYFIAALIIAGLSFYLNGWVIPQSNRERIDFELQYFKKNNLTSRSNIHMQIEPNVYLFIQNFNSLSNMGHQFTLERFDSNRLVEKLTAENIQWDTAKLKWTLRYWKRKQVDSIFHIQKTGAAIDLLTKGDAVDTTLAISPQDFEATDRGYDGMTINELTNQIEKMRFRGNTGVEVYETEKQIRYAIPFTIFVLVFMGVLVSARKSRGGTGFQIALGFLLSFIFILFFTMTRTFAEAGSLPPFFAAWLPNGVFVVISLVMYKYVPR